MNAVDVVKWELNDSELVHKFENDNIRLGSQLIVYPSQTAFFVKGGKILDEFKSGTYTIKSDNIPLLEKFINIPYDGKSPFKAEVWFVNQIEILNNKWGTLTPIQVEDPKYDVIVPIRAFGQYGMHIDNPRLFLEKLVGNMSIFETTKLIDYFKGVILSKLTNIIYDTLRQTGNTVLTISSQLEELSSFAQSRLSQVFASYGVKLELFQIMSISVKENDPSYLRLKDAKDAKARINVIGRGDYQMARSFDVMEKAANNPGSFAGAGVGIGAGFGLGNVMASLTAANLSINSDVPPAIPAKVYYVAVNGQQQGPFSKEEIDNKFNSGVIDATTLIWTKGMRQWAPLLKSADFSHLFTECPPPIPT